MCVCVCVCVCVSVCVWVCVCVCVSERGFMNKGCKLAPSRSIFMIWITQLVVNPHIKLPVCMPVSPPGCRPALPACLRLLLCMFSRLLAWLLGCFCLSSEPSRLQCFVFRLARKELTHRLHKHPNQNKPQHKPWTTTRHADPSSFEIT